MSPRPESLFGLFADMTGLAGIGARNARHFATMDIARPRDLVMTLPYAGIDRNPKNSIREVTAPVVTTVEVEVGTHHPNAVKGRPYRVTVRDAATSFQLVFFHARAEWLRRNLPAGQRRIVSGKVELFDGVAQMVHPDHILRADEAGAIPVYEPVYPLCAGLTQKGLQRALASALERLPDLAEWIEPGIRSRCQWPGWRAALQTAHAPQSSGDLLPAAPPRERLAYDELFAHQLTLALARSRQRRAPGRANQSTGKLQDKVLKSLPFKATKAQSRAIAEIAADMGGKHRMNRLLQGDVGSGKTLVAWLALLIAVEAGGQGVMMAPTEILARQHLETLLPLAEIAGLTLEILTGRDTGKSRVAKLQRLANGATDVLLGTHAVFQKDIKFNDLRLAVIDEQHRFGVRQRMDLGAKGAGVDVLVMTATPIPRSLALAQYGDMDVSVLDEKPPGRKPVRTVVMPAGRIDEVVAHLKSALAEDRQVYWVCPLVQESELVEWTAAADRYQALRHALGEENVGLVHGQMQTAEKDAAMAAFIAGQVRVLVATTVIEVGVDVPAASIMVIEQAENFGLAQLHQLRGRVGRGAAQSSCLLIYSPPLGNAAHQRLMALRDSDDGFYLAEQDLKLRGAGDVLGVAQSGLPKFRIADLEIQADLMKLAQDDARLLLATDPDLTSARGQAAQVLLHLMEQEKSIQMISVG